MNKRNTQQRRRAIVELLEEAGEVSVEMLSSQFHTSEVTIRKDLSALEANGLLMRRYGGAVPVPQEFISDLAALEASPVKQAIAELAATLIRDHNRIIIDSGTTTSALLPKLATKQGLVVMTNSLAVANALRELENEPTLLMTGGTWDARSESFQGQLAEQMLRAFDFDQLFIGADGIDPARGTTTFNELYHLSRVMAEVSREVIVVAEAGKIGRKIPNLELPWVNVSTLVTDNTISAEQRLTIESHGVNVVTATVPERGA